MQVSELAKRNATLLSRLPSSSSRDQNACRNSSRNNSEGDLQTLAGSRTHSYGSIQALCKGESDSESGSGGGGSGETVASGPSPLHRAVALRSVGNGDRGRGGESVGGGREGGAGVRRGGVGEESGAGGGGALFRPVNESDRGQLLV